MDMEKAGLWTKVFLYNFDIASDWLNGYKLRQRAYAPSKITSFAIDVPNNFTLWTNETIFKLRTGNDSFNVETIECPGDNHVHPWEFWGLMSISFTWLPAIVGFVGLLMGIKRAAQAGKWKNMFFGILLLPFRFILWPFLVPIKM